MNLINKDETEKAVHGYFHEDESASYVISQLPSAFAGMTNGEVLEAIFPNIEPIHDIYKRQRYGFKGCALESFDFKTSKTWWDAPYDNRPRVKAEEYLKGKTIKNIERFGDNTTFIFTDGSEVTFCTENNYSVNDEGVVLI